jgi:hypothetical protein
MDMKYWINGCPVNLDRLSDEELNRLARSTKVRLETVQRELRTLDTQRCYRNLVPEARRPSPYEQLNLDDTQPLPVVS